MRTLTDETAFADTLPAIRMAITEELKNDELGTWLTVRTIASPATVRHDPGWDGTPDWPAVPGDPPITRRRASVGRVEVAYELSGSVTFTRDRVSDGDQLQHNVVEPAIALATDLRRDEQSLILGSIMRAATATHFVATSAGVAQAVGYLRRSLNARCCHLLTTDDKLRTQAKTDGLVDDAFHVTDVLAGPWRGLVVATVNGPVVERIVDDVTLTSRVLDTGALEVALVQRFFLLGRGQAVKLL